MQFPSYMCFRESTSFSHVTRVGGSLVAVGIAAGSHVTLVTFSEEDGSEITQQSVPAGWVTKETECIIVSGTQLVCLDSASVALQLLDLENPDMFKPHFPEVCMDKFILPACLYVLCVATDDLKLHVLFHNFMQHEAEIFKT